MAGSIFGGAFDFGTALVAVVPFGAFGFAVLSGFVAAFDSVAAFGFDADGARVTLMLIPFHGGFG
jgi:hypothetical protein